MISRRSVFTVIALRLQTHAHLSPHPTQLPPPSLFRWQIWGMRAFLFSFLVFGGCVVLLSFAHATSARARAHTHTCSHVHKPAHTFTHVHTLAHTCTHLHTHTHTRTHTHTHTQEEDMQKIDIAEFNILCKSLSSGCHNMRKYDSDSSFLRSWPHS